MTELYLNYDCDCHAPDLFENLIQQLAKNVQPVSGIFATHLLSLETLLIVVDAIEANCSVSVSIEANETSSIQQVLFTFQQSLFFIEKETNKSFSQYSSLWVQVKTNQSPQKLVFIWINQNIKSKYRNRRIMKNLNMNQPISLLAAVVLHETKPSRNKKWRYTRRKILRSSVTKNVVNLNDLT